MSLVGTPSRRVPILTGVSAVQDLRHETTHRNSGRTVGLSRVAELLPLATNLTRRSSCVGDRRGNTLPDTTNNENLPGGGPEPGRRDTRSHHVRTPHPA